MHTPDQQATVVTKEKQKRKKKERNEKEEEKKNKAGYTAGQSRMVGQEQ